MSSLTHSSKKVLFKYDHDVLAISRYNGEEQRKIMAMATIYGNFNRNTMSLALSKQLFNLMSFLSRFFWRNRNHLQFNSLANLFIHVHQAETFFLPISFQRTTIPFNASINRHTIVFDTNPTTNIFFIFRLSRLIIRLELSCTNYIKT